MADEHDQDRIADVINAIGQYGEELCEATGVCQECVVTNYALASIRRIRGLLEEESLELFDAAILDEICDLDHEDDEEVSPELWFMDPQEETMH